MKSRPTTAGTKIRTQANALVDKLMGCQPHCMFNLIFQIYLLSGF